MPAIKITIEHKDGSVWYTTNPTEIRTVGLSLPRSIHWVKSSDVKTLSNTYFSLLTEVVKNSGLGYSKVDLHNALKPMLFNKIKDFPHYFTSGEPSMSTKDLNHEGWVAIIQQLKIEVNDICGYVFTEQG